MGADLGAYTDRAAWSTSTSGKRGGAVPQPCNR